LAARSHADANVMGETSMDLVPVKHTMPPMDQDDIVSEGAIDRLVNHESPEVELPIIWNFGLGGDPDDGRGGPPVDDPLTIYVTLPFGPDMDNPAIWSFTLEALITDDIELHAEFVPVAKRVTARLREIADKIDERYSAVDNRDAEDQAPDRPISTL
jgi:hypothetical protein